MSRTLRVTWASREVAAERQELGGAGAPVVVSDCTRYIGRELRSHHHERWRAANRTPGRIARNHADVSVRRGRNVSTHPSSNAEARCHLRSLSPCTAAGVWRHGRGLRGRGPPQRKARSPQDVEPSARERVRPRTLPARRPPGCFNQPSERGAPAARWHSPRPSSFAESPSTSGPTSTRLAPLFITCSPDASRLRIARRFA